jgi:hypothetical protein
MKEFFNLRCSYEDMSPVVMPSGYTRAFLDGTITEEQQVSRIKQAYARASSHADMVGMRRRTPRTCAWHHDTPSHTHTEYQD